MRIGLTGGIGSGKSEVAEVFESLGALIIDTDLLARDAVAAHTDGLHEIGRVWPQVLKHGTLDRAKLAEIVFNDPVARERLNGIVHPHVRRLAERMERQAKPGQIIVQVVPLLFESKLEGSMDKTVVVIAPDAERIKRTMKRDNLRESGVVARMKTQIDPVIARKRANYVILNDGDLKRLQARAKIVFEKLMESG